MCIENQIQIDVFEYEIGSTLVEFIQAPFAKDRYTLYVPEIHDFVKDWLTFTGNTLFCSSCAILD